MEKVCKILALHRISYILVDYNTVALVDTTDENHKSVFFWLLSINKTKSDTNKGKKGKKTTKITYQLKHFFGEDYDIYYGDLGKLIDIYKFKKVEEVERPSQPYLSDEEDN